LRPPSTPPVCGKPFSIHVQPKLNNAELARAVKMLKALE